MGDQSGLVKTPDPNFVFKMFSTASPQKLRVTFHIDQSQRLIPAMAAEGINELWSLADM